MRYGSLVIAFACGWVAALSARADVVEEIVKLPVDDAIVVPYLRGHDEARAPSALAILFNGGEGNVRLLSQGIPKPGANFLVRSRQLFNRATVATAVIDIRSDHSGMTDSERMSRRHAEDVARVAADMRARYGTLPLYLVGTSRGSTSAAYTATVLGSAVSGVVLTSSVLKSSRAGPGLSGFDFTSISVPMLFVHHAEDACPVTPYPAAVRAAEGRTLVTVHGGAAPRSAPCEAFSAHGYLGMEAPTVDAIVRWIHGESVPVALRPTEPRD